jgi:hypothetical protein
MLSGEIAAQVKNNKPAPPQSGQPPGTLSQEVWYFENGEEVARIHQYVRPDGRLGGSGVPDPKRLYENGKAYRLRHPAKNWKEKLRFKLSDFRDRLVWAVGREIDD